MSKKRCIYNIKNCCHHKRSIHYLKKCKSNCKIKFRNKKEKTNIVGQNFNIVFKKKNNQLILMLNIPIEYNNIHKMSSTQYYLCFDSRQLKKQISLRILLYNIESYMEFLFNNFHNQVRVKSSRLYIWIHDIPEITKNETSYNKLKRNFILHKQIESNYGRININLKIDKDIVFSSIMEIIKNDSVQKSKLMNKQKKKVSVKNYNSGLKETISKKQTTPFKYIPEPQYVSSVVLSYNRKCFNEKHTIIDIIAIIKVATHSGIIEVKKPAAYCPECSQYIILKSDYKNIKKQGVLLCEVIDKTPKHLEKHNNQSYTGTESRVHALGYNVIKEYGYTYKQRKIILANIMENYNISKHEILSMLDTNIARKIKLPNYADAVSKWKEDREFVENYKRGDIPEVLIDKVTIGKR